MCNSYPSTSVLNLKDTLKSAYSLWVAQNWIPVVGCRTMTLVSVGKWLAVQQWPNNGSSEGTKLVILVSSQLHHTSFINSYNYSLMFLSCKKHNEEGEIDVSLRKLCYYLLRITNESHRLHNTNIQNSVYELPYTHYV